MKPLVSVVITTKNEEKNIGNCLESIRLQSYKNIEVIVVDNNSKDNTKKIAKKYTNKVFNLKKNKVRNFRGAQLNFGVSKAKGGIIFFPDADMSFSKDLIKEAVKKMLTFEALFVPEIIVGKGFFGKVRDFERSFYNQTSIDAVRFVKKELFKSVGGFDESICFGPDDWDFTKKVKKETNKINITDSVLFHNEKGLDIKSYLNKKSDYLNTFDEYVGKWGKNDKDVRKQFGFYYRFFGVFFENQKYYKLFSHPILTLGIYYLKFRVGLNYLTKNIKNQKEVI